MEHLIEINISLYPCKYPSLGIENGGRVCVCTFRVIINWVGYIQIIQLTGNLLEREREGEQDWWIKRRSGL